MSNVEIIKIVSTSSVVSSNDNKQIYVCVFINKKVTIKWKTNFKILFLYLLKKIKLEGFLTLSILRDNLQSFATK